MAWRWKAEAYLESTLPRSFLLTLTSKLRNLEVMLEALALRLESRAVRDSDIFASTFELGAYKHLNMPWPHVANLKSLRILGHPTYVQQVSLLRMFKRLRAMIYLLLKSMEGFITEVPEGFVRYRS